MALSVVILAAGQGKRMFSDRPKVLHQLAGRSLLAHVIETAQALRPDRVCVVYGHGGEQVPQAIGDRQIIFVKQEPQLGTGDALKQALPHLGTGDKTLVLYGDVPLIRGETLQSLVAGETPRVVVLSAELDDPSGYGRVVRDKRGQITSIVEDKDASALQRKIREVNTGIMVLPTAHLQEWLSKLKNRNAQREYYLTDVVSLALADHTMVEAVKAVEAWETLGVNSRAQLAQLERI